MAATAPPPPARPTPALAAAALFLVSGAAGLLYEVLWSRQLARVLGGSYPAVVAVVTAFLAGLALGAGLAGRRAGRVRRPLRLYALLEAGIGLYCLAFPLLLDALHPVFGACYRGLADHPALHTAARFLLAGLLLGPPTVAMGATLPLLVRAVVRKGGSTVLGGTGLLYGINTLGAAGGAAATGLLLLPALGFHGTLLVGVGANLLVAAAALLLDRGRPDLPPEEEPAAASAGEPGAPSRRARAALLAVALGGGAASMLYQLGWTRTLVMSFGSSVHAFTLVVAVFILGIGIGGLLVPLARASGTRLLALLVAAEAAVGLAGAFATVQAGILPLAVIEFVGAGVPDYGALLRWEAARILGIALLPTAAMGAVFPLLIAAVARGAGDASRAVGRVYTLNTVGVVAGSLGGGMLLLPALGTRGALVTASVLNLLLAAGAAVALLPRRAGRASAALLLAAAALAAVATPPWPPHRVHSGPFLYARNYLKKADQEGISLDRTLRNLHWDMPFEKEGRSVSAAVIRAPDGNAFLRVNGKTDASSVEDMDTQLMLGHIPMLLHPAPKRVMVVGLATGVTAAAAASHLPESLDAAEISGEVREAERLFRDVNADVTHRPFVRVLLEDGRTHLEHSSLLYDVVISEPTNPWIAGVSDLFTVEYFEAVKARLAPGGIAGFWIHAYGLGGEDFRLLVRTVLSVFPGAAVWETSPWQDYMVVAPRDGNLDPAAAAAARAWPDRNSEAAASLGAAGIRSREDLLGLLFLSPAAARSFAGEGELHTDDRLQLEFRAPRRTLSTEAGAITPEELDRIRAAQPLPAAPGIDPVRMAQVRHARGLAIEGLAAQRGSSDGRAGAPILRALMEDRRRLDEVLPEVPKEAREAVQASLRGEPAGPGAEGSGEAVLLGLAVERGRRAFEEGQREVWAMNGLAQALLLRGHLSLSDGAGRDAAEDFLSAGRLQFWNSMAPYLESYALYRLAFTSRDPDLLQKALDLANLALDKNPHCEPALVHRGVVLERMGRREEARKALLGALEIRPDSVKAMGALAEIALAAGDEAEARLWLDRGLELEPENRGLVLLQGRAGRP